MTNHWAPLRLWHRRPGDCGPCCLYLVLRYYGINVTLSKVRRVTGWTWRGSSMQGLTKGAKTLGFDVTCLRMPVDQLPDITHPVIAHFQGNHFVVVPGSDAHQVLVADPRLGLGEVSREIFSEMWSGNLLDLTVTGY